MKDETSGVAAELKPQRYSFLVDDSGEHQQRGERKCCCNNIVNTSHSE